MWCCHRCDKTTICDAATGVTKQQSNTLHTCDGTTCERWWCCHRCVVSCDSRGQRSSEGVPTAGSSDTASWHTTLHSRTFNMEHSHWHTTLHSRTFNMEHSHWHTTLHSRTFNMEQSSDIPHCTALPSTWNTVIWHTTLHSRNLQHGESKLVFYAQSTGTVISGQFQHGTVSWQTTLHSRNLQYGVSKLVFYTLSTGMVISGQFQHGTVSLHTTPHSHAFNMKQTLLTCSHVNSKLPHKICLVELTTESK